jgi:NADH-quinone oxidoreductase subunit A
MSLLTIEYSSIGTFMVFAIVLASVLFALSYLLGRKAGDTEKLSPYECGFDPFDDARNVFDIRFYLVAILFILFDLETAFLFPWAVSLSEMDLIGFWSMFDFIFELVIGFIYAWKIGALEWE